MEGSSGPFATASSVGLLMQQTGNGALPGVPAPPRPGVTTSKDENNASGPLPNLPIPVPPTCLPFPHLSTGSPPILPPPVCLPTLPSLSFAPLPDPSSSPLSAAPAAGDDAPATSSVEEGDGTHSRGRKPPGGSRKPSSPISRKRRGGELTDVDLSKEGNHPAPPRGSFPGIPNVSPPPPVRPPQGVPPPPGPRFSASTPDRPVDAASRAATPPGSSVAPPAGVSPVRAPPPMRSVPGAVPVGMPGAAVPVPSAPVAPPPRAFAGPPSHVAAGPGSVHGASAPWGGAGSAGAAPAGDGRGQLSAPGSTQESKPSLRSKLNPKASEFKLNPGASEFKPKAPSAAPKPPPAGPGAPGTPTASPASMHSGHGSAGWSPAPQQSVGQSPGGMPHVPMGHVMGPMMSFPQSSLPIVTGAPHSAAPVMLVSAPQMGVPQAQPGPHMRQGVMVPGTMPQVMMQGQPGMMPQQAMAASASGPPGSQTAPMMVPMAVPGHPTFVYTGGVPTGQMVMMPMSAPPPAAPAAAASQAPAQGGAEQGAQSN